MPGLLCRGWQWAVKLVESYVPGDTFLKRPVTSTALLGGVLTLRGQLKLKWVFEALDIRNLSGPRYHKLSGHKYQKVK